MKVALLATMTALAVFVGMQMYSSMSEGNSIRMLAVDPVDSAWIRWKAKYIRGYQTTSDEAYRKSIFSMKYHQVAQHNSKYRLGESTYYKELNQFADLSDEEFAKQYLSYKPAANKLSANKYQSSGLSTCRNVDRTSDLGSVKDQGQCGSCWAFSAIGSIEGRFYSTTGQRVRLSEQELVSCDNYSSGCNGGDMETAIFWLEMFKYNKRKYPCLESQYPYTSGTTKQSGTCPADVDSQCSTDSNVRVTGHVSIDSSSYTNLYEPLNEGVVSVGVDAANWSTYGGGVFDSCMTRIDHGVTLVGVSCGDDGYWKIRNSWGAAWGESGYIR